MAQGDHSGSRPESKRIVHRPTGTLDTLAILKGGTAKTGITLDHKEKNETKLISHNLFTINPLR